MQKAALIQALRKDEGGVGKRGESALQEGDRRSRKE